MATALSPTPLYGYARQSVTRDGSESLPMQVERCEEAAARLGGRIVRWFVEAPSTSGYKNRGRSRGKFAEMLAALPSGEARGIIVYKSERLSRGGGPGWAPVFDAIDAAGLNPDRAVATPNGWMSEFEIGMRATMDREESKKLSDRMLDVRAREAAAGRPREGGRRPFGYSCSKRAEKQGECTLLGCRHDGAMSVIPAEAEMIREAAERVLLGESPYAVARSWNARGAPHPGGGHWQAQTLKRVLRSGRIAGQREHLGEIVGEATWPAIIDRATAEQVRINLAERATPALPVRPRSFLLSGFIRCACGARLSTRRRGGARREYVCQNKEASGARIPSCGALVIHADPVEADAFEVVMGSVLDPATMARLNAAAPARDDGRDLGAEIRTLEGRKAKLLDLYLDGGSGLGKRDYLARLAEVDGQLATLHAELAVLATHPVLATLPTTEEALRAAWGERGIEWQRLVVEAVVAGVSVKRGRAARIADRLVYDLR